MVMYLLCLARLPSKLINERPSVVVAAALYLARATLGIKDLHIPAYPHKYWSRTLQHYTGYSVADLYQSIMLIYNYQLHAPNLSIAPFDKYERQSCLKVSLIAARHLEDLGLSDSDMTYEKCCDYKSAVSYNNSYGRLSGVVNGELAMFEALT